MASRIQLMPLKKDMVVRTQLRSSYFLSDRRDVHRANEGFRLRRSARGMVAVLQTAGQDQQRMQGPVRRVRRADPEGVPAREGLDRLGRFIL